MSWTLALFTLHLTQS